MAKKSSASLSALRPYIALLTTQKYWLILGFIFTVATLFASVGLLSVSGWFLTGTALAGGTPELTAIAYNFFQPAAIVRGFALSRTVGRWSERVINHEATFRLLAKFRSWLFKGIAPLSPQQRQHYHGGTLLNRITRDIDALDNLYIRLLLPVLASLLLMSVITFVSVYFYPPLLMPFGILMIVGFILLPLIAWHLGRHIAPQAQIQQQQLRVHLLELVDGLETLSLKRNAWQMKRQVTLTASKQWLNNNWQLHKRASTMSHSMGALIGLMALFALILMSYSDLDGIWIGGGTLLMLACAELLIILSDSWLRLPGTCQSAIELSTLHDNQSEITYPKTSKALPKNNSINIQQLSFFYDEVKALDKINLTINTGSHCLIQGNSGGGKTTLIQLITRQLANQQGNIKLGGVSVADFSERELRQKLALAPQTTYLFTDTLANNLRVANQNASDETLWKMLVLVDLADIVQQLPQQLDTLIAEGGANLSGGQRRRLGIARALLIDADCVILDEPTEGLDIESEERLIKEVTNHLRGKTLLWVSHRTTALDYFDQRIVLSEGRIQLSS